MAGKIRKPYLLMPMAAAAAGLLPGCIANDIPYPRIPQMILAIAAQGEEKPAYIDSLAFEVNIYLEEQTDIRDVRFSRYEVSPGGVSSPDLLEGSYDLTDPLWVDIERYQSYGWEIKAIQNITRWFEVDGEVGASVIDPVGHRVIVTMPEGADMARLYLKGAKLGPEGITTTVPDLAPGYIDLEYPLRVEVTAHGRTDVWTIYAEITETIVSTAAVDAWSQVIWAYGAGPADADNGFEYKRADATEWTRVAAEDVIHVQGSFSCRIAGLEPLTEYSVRTYSGDNTGNQVDVATEAVADIPDGDFEQWHKTDNGMWNPWDLGGTRFWDTGNSGSITLKQNLTEPSDHTPTGSGLAARCETKFVNLFGIGKLGTGSIFTGEYLRTDGTNGVLGFGRPWTLRPTRLRGFYQYSAVDIDYADDSFANLKGRPDSCHIYVALTDWTAPYEIRTKPADRQLFDKDAAYVIAYGELVVSSRMDAYKPFEIELKYRDTGRRPSYLQITAAASKYGDYFTGGAGSVLFVDQFSFGWDY